LVTGQLNLAEFDGYHRLRIDWPEVLGPLQVPEIAQQTRVNDLYALDFVEKMVSEWEVLHEAMYVAAMVDDPAHVHQVGQFGPSGFFRLSVAISRGESVASPALLSEFLSIAATQDIQQLYPTPIPSPLPLGLEERFRQISNLPYNWNSYGAHPIATEIIEATKRLVGEGLRLGLPVPGVAPASGSAMSVEWETDLGELIVEIEPNTVITYLLTLEADGSEYEGLLEDNSFGSVVSQLMESES
jgi:hypothetical protein